MRCEKRSVQWTVIRTERIAEYDYDPVGQTSTLLREYIWMDGRAVAVVEGGVI